MKRSTLAVLVVATLGVFTAVLVFAQAAQVIVAHRKPLLFRVVALAVQTLIKLLDGVLLRFHFFRARELHQIFKRCSGFGFLFVWFEERPIEAAVPFLLGALIGNYHTRGRGSKSLLRQGGIERTLAREGFESFAQLLFQSPEAIHTRS